MDADNLHRRLKKIIGQLGAIDKMVDQDVPCEDMLMQINAAKSARTRWDRWCWRGISTTASGTASSTETRTGPLRNSPKPSSTSHV